MEKFRSQLIGLLLVGLTLAVFLPAGGHDFVWDDTGNIVENPYLNPPIFANALRFWEKPYEKLYIPLTYSVWAGLARVAQMPAERGDVMEFSPRLFHLANVGFHILAALVIFGILKMLVRHDWAAFGGALFFALHPLQVEPVAWITGLKDVLSGCLSLVAIWLYLKHKGFHYVLATLAFVLAMLAKPGAITVPVVAWVLDYWLLRRSARQCALTVIPWIVLAIPFIIVNKLAQPDTIIPFFTPLWARPLVAADALAFYLYKLALPLWLGPDYGRSPEWLLQRGWVYITWVIPFGILILIWRWRERKPWLLASAGVFVAGMLPVSGLVPFVFQSLSTVADRYLYLSLLGPALALAFFLAAKKRKVAVVFCVGTLALLGLRSAFQVSHWRDETTLYRHALSVNANSSLAYYNLGNALAERGMVENAIVHYREAVRISPRYPDARNNLGAVLARVGRLDEAIEQYREAIRIDPTYAKAYYNFGNARIRQGEWDEAVERYGQAIKADPGYSMAYNNLGIALVNRGDVDAGIEHLRHALELNPRLAIAHRNLGYALAKRGRIDEAIERYREAVRIEPEFAQAHEELARLLAQRGKREEAIGHVEETRRIMKAGPAKP